MDSFVDGDVVLRALGSSCGRCQQPNKKRFIAESESDIFKSVNIRQISKQERGSLVHFLRLLAVCWPGAQSAWGNHDLACNFAKYSPILIFFHS